MNKFRSYGDFPFQIVLVHGGPGAAGEMGSVAKVLSKKYTVLEPFQTKTSLKGQVEELKAHIQERGDVPVILIGYSWGAWISFILAAEYPDLVEKLILISSGPFEAKYAESITQTRLSRLNEQEKEQLEQLIGELSHSKEALEKLAKFITKADAYDPLDEKEEMWIDSEIYQKVWPEGDLLRESGALLQYGKSIQCPVVAIHGDYDPHPVEGVENPLSQVIKNFNCILLKQCGHKPWIERQAKDTFYEVLNEQL